MRRAHEVRSDGARAFAAHPRVRSARLSWSRCRRQRRARMVRPEGSDGTRAGLRRLHLSRWSGWFPRWIVRRTPKRRLGGRDRGGADRFALAMV